MIACRVGTDWLTVKFAWSQEKDPQCRNTRAKFWGDMAQLHQWALVNHEFKGCSRVKSISRSRLSSREHLARHSR